MATDPVPVGTLIEPTREDLRVQRESVAAGMASAIFNADWVEAGRLADIHAILSEQIDLRD